MLGLFTELGPFRPNEDMSLSLNPFRWNKVANVVFMEAPCGVGFSYSNSSEYDRSDYKNNDEGTADDNYDFIQAFLSRFPSYRGNDLYITSESYGGHYMPTLARKIVNKNREIMNGSSSDLNLNFKGFAVGNPFTNKYSGYQAMLETWWNKQLMSEPTWKSFKEGCIDNEHASETHCAIMAFTVEKEIGNINVYAMDYPTCKYGSVLKTNEEERKHNGRHEISAELNAQREALLVHTRTHHDIHPELLMNFKNSLKRPYNRIKLEGTTDNENNDGIYAGYEPCGDYFTTQYLNLAEVKAAIHVKEDMVWQLCANGITLTYDYSDSDISMVPVYTELLEDVDANLRILVFSGDDDAVCSTLGTQDWIWDIDGLGNPSLEWSEYSVDGQASGYISSWPLKKFAFLTVHGAGHEVPAYMPKVALDMWEKYLQGYWTCDGVDENGHNACTLPDAN